VTDWLVIGGYLLGWVLTARRVALAMIEADARRELEHRSRMGRDHRTGEPYKQGRPLVDMDERVASLFFASLIGLVWPLALAFMAVAGTLRAPTERLAEQRAELERLRKLAHEHGLPMPGEGGDAA
jgi:hypothetical protein